MVESIYDMIVSSSNRRMLRQVLEFPQLLARGIEDGLEVAEDGGIIHCEGSSVRVYWYGMGASALIGDYIRAYCLYSKSKESLEVFVERSHELKYDPNENALYVFYSYSGNTFETLCTFRKALTSIPAEKIITFSSGGKIGEIAKDKGIINISIPSGYVSRSHFPYGLGAAVAVLSKYLGNLDILSEIKEAVDIIAEDISSDMIEYAKVLNLTARKMASKIAVLMADYTLEPVARRFIAQLNENSKHFATFFEIPEGCHNFIVGIRHMHKKCFMVVLRRESEDEFIRNTINTLTRHILKCDCLEYKIEDGETYSWSTLLKPTFFIDLLSIFLADIKGENAFDITEIVSFKQSIGGG